MNESVWRCGAPEPVCKEYVAYTADYRFRRVVWAQEYYNKRWRWWTEHGDTIDDCYIVRYTDAPDVDPDEMKQRRDIFYKIIARQRRLPPVFDAKKEN